MRPYFPKKAVVTGGMPYGDKHLHSGHVGGCLVHADIYARFLRDRIGKDNVIFVTGTDCYGAGPVVKHQQAVENGFEGTIEDFVEGNHLAQKRALKDYNISLDYFGASALYEGGRIQKELSVQLFEKWYKEGYLFLGEVEQFYDDENETILNGRQVEGRCPVAKCKSSTAYADECEMGHQYNPRDLIMPKIVTTGKTPSLKAVKNWYFDLERFGNALKERQGQLEEEGLSRKFLMTNVADFLKDPAILIKTEDFETLRKAMADMPSHLADINEEKQSATLTFKALKNRETACAILQEHGIRFRTGTTLVPFRLTGNVKWGIPVPEIEGVTDQTFYVWPESLWIPMAFVQAALLEAKGSNEGWEDYWNGEDSRVYQFIGEDNIYYYAVAGMGLFMALNEMAGRPHLELLPRVVPNRHLFFGNRKASSSGDVKPPSAESLLDYYTVEQLRMHFAHMSLQSNSASFKPKALTGEEGFDATLAEGNILTNVYNRLIRSCFYTAQKYFDGKLPNVEVSEDAKKAADKVISDYEWAMYRFEFSKIIDMLDVYLRDANKAWAANAKTEDDSVRAQTLVDAFHVVRIAAILLHPFAPEGTEKVREYLGADENMWNWEYIDKTPEYNFNFLEPRVDFFYKHESQLKESK